MPNGVAGRGQQADVPRCPDSLEFKIPYMPAEYGQSHGNSGVYLHALYEIQVLDSFETPTYANGSCGALYGQAAPLVNVSLSPEHWQTYDSLPRAPLRGWAGQAEGGGDRTAKRHCGAGPRRY